MAIPQSIKSIIYLILAFTLFPLIPGAIQMVKNTYGKHFDPRTHVGVIPIKGVLYNAQPYLKQLTKFFKDDTIKAILLKIDCPGSASGTGETIFRTIDVLKKEYRKPVVVLVENMCTSGAYYISCACDHIVTPATALIGSIGIRMSHLFQVKDFLEQHHIKYVPIKAGAFKTVADPFTDLTEAERSHLQGVLDDTYRQFTHDVSTSRKLPYASVSEWADGRIFTGQQAKDIGLVDEIGTLHHAIKVIKEKALIEGEIKWIHYKPKTGILSMLGRDSDDEDSSFAKSCLDYLFGYVESRYQKQTML